jgi:hypothetical protein
MGQCLVPVAASKGSTALQSRAQVAVLGNLKEAIPGAAIFGRRHAFLDQPEGLLAAAALFSLLVALAKLQGAGTGRS